MGLLYKSTRGGQKGILASTAIIQGIADDGGLFVPEAIPTLQETLESLQSLSYQDLAYEIMKYFFTDFTEQELKSCIESAYDQKFDTSIIAPVVSTSKASFLELFHGPTLAFKDMALSILPYLLKTAARKQQIDKEIVILTATSGDTGKAALEGFANVKGTKIIVFFPEDGVSPIQKQQMVTQKGDNTYVIGIKGNFDDAQSGVKKIFTDLSFQEQLAEKGYLFSSANSINIGRLVPQIVYYFYGYFQMVNQGKIRLGDSLHVTVPTGNFGNILAAYYAKQMGLPIGKLICASNDNKVLYDFFQTGIYNQNREFMVTISPSMDILISSNLERLLYHMSGEDAVQVKEWMNQLIQKGQYQITEEMKERLQLFYGGYATIIDTQEGIKELFQQTGYLIDTHTAVAYQVDQQYKKESGDTTPTLIVSTASPYKFTKSVMESLDKEYGKWDDFVLLEKIQELSKVNIPTTIKGLDKMPILHKTICQKEKMKEEVAHILGI
ncbi:MAG: threonine synthase [Epulopiscium sp.]|nr:threonine synthase [Candidatus Epulonipiscium sp.]